MGYIKRISLICLTALLCAYSANAVTYDQVKEKVEQAERAKNGVNGYQNPVFTMNFGLGTIDKMNRSFENEYNDAKRDINIAKNNIILYNGETNNDSSVTALTSEATLNLGGARAVVEGDHGKGLIVKAYNNIKAAFDKLQPEEAVEEATPFKNGSLVTIKVKGKYVDANTAGNVKLEDTLDSISQIFLVTVDGANIGFQPMKNFIDAYNYLEFPAGSPILINASWNFTKFFGLQAVSGKADTYNLKFKNTRKYVKQSGDTLKAEDMAIDGKTYFEFEIKEFTLDNPAAKTILDDIDSFGRKDLITIKSVFKNKYISSSRESNTSGIVADYAKKVTLESKPNFLSVFKVTMNATDRNNMIELNNYEDFFGEGGNWQALVSTYRLGFMSGLRSVFDTGDSTCYFNTNVLTKNLHTALWFTKVPNQNYYIIKNAKFDKYLRVNENNEVVADETEDDALTSQDCWFEVKEFNITGATTKDEEIPPSVPFNDGDFVTIKDDRGVYFQMSSNNQGQFYYNTRKGDNQVLRVKRNADNSYSFLVTANGKTGMLQSNPSYARFTPNKTSPDQSGVNSFYLYSKGNNSFAIKGLDNNKFKNRNSWAIKDTDLSFENLPGTAIFTIEKIEQQSEIPSVPGQGVSLIKLQPGFYRIKNVETNKYMTIKNQNLDSTVYKRSDGSLWNIYSLRFENAANDATQIFKIEPEGDYHKITGSLDGKYQSPSKGVFNSGFGTVYFDKVMSTDTPGYRKAKITQQAGVQGYFLTSKKDGNSRYGVDNDKLIKDKQNSRFIFEKVEAPSSEQEEPPKLLKVTGINMELKKVLGGLTKVSVGGSLICGINSSNQIYKWDNLNNNWKKFSDAKYKDVSVGQDNTLLAIGTDKNIYIHYKNEWKLFSKGLLSTLEREQPARLDLKPGELPSPDQVSSLPTPGTPTVISIPGSIGGVPWESAQSIPMKQISVGARDHIWALGENNKSYMWSGSDWVDKSQGNVFSQISVGMDGTVKAIGLDKKLMSWNGANWQISPFKLHQVCVINKDKHWAVTKEDDGGFNVYKFTNNGYILRAKNLQQISANLEGTIFGISTIIKGRDFEIYARIIKLFGKILDKINSASAKKTVKEKIETLEQAIILADPAKIAAELKPDEHGALKNQTYTVLYGMLTTDLEKAKNEKVLTQLKSLVDKATASVLIEENIKPLLKNFADTNIKIETETSTDTKKDTSTRTPPYRRSTRRTTRQSPASRARTSYSRPGSRGGRFVR